MSLYCLPVDSCPKRDRQYFAPAKYFGVTHAVLPDGLLKRSSVSRQAIYVLIPISPEVQTSSSLGTNYKYLVIIGLDKTWVVLDEVFHLVFLPH